MTFVTTSDFSVWYVYLLQCSDNTFYCGVTTDLNRRLEEHNNSQGAKYTRNRLPVSIVWFSECSNRQHACQEEYRIKQLTRKQKKDLIYDKVK